MEVGLDKILNEGLLKDIPFCSTVISVYHIGTGIRDSHYIKKLAIFIDTINSGIASEAERKKHIDIIQADKKKSAKELEYILILIDRYIRYEKPKMLARLYLAYLRQSISWDTFIVYADVIDRLLPKDEELLFISFPVNEEYMNDKSPNNRLDTYARLVSLGLMRESPRRETLRDIERVNKNLKHYERTDFGKKFAEIIKE